MEREGLWLEGRVLQSPWVKGGTVQSTWGQTHISGLSRDGIASDSGKGGTVQSTPGARPTSRGSQEMVLQAISAMRGHVDLDLHRITCSSPQCDS